MLLHRLSESLYLALDRYIKENYTPEETASEGSKHPADYFEAPPKADSSLDMRERKDSKLSFSALPQRDEEEYEDLDLLNGSGHPPVHAEMYSMCAPESGASLEERIRNVDKGFSETLMDLIDESGMKDSECYRRANVDRRVFSRIRSNPGYRPSKSTALAFCIALSLSPEEAESLLNKAGFALSDSSKTDVIVRYFLERRPCDINEVNDALWEFDQKLLGV